ncbi:ACP S-malonyltransferase [Phycicoccus sonneratiae]|uniref:[acyl-carrier-protein] S-malonyltransferase n=1 Tax=Phycicoccus sonneratiae TaxID=2807628 RepID=A0ABS2CHG5_9MICO|nr:ACP S-malonyltransferase [Phycicoccus sonneraticus]MBM6399308.1 ACP S-malonyltransferase [Phycicoccus sonneraticus]
MIVIVCPGQGSQTPGFLAPWLELPGAREHLTALSDAAGVDLVAHGTTSDEETIKDTAVAQPLLVGAGLLALRALGDHTPPGALAGHSVGEITAAAAAGVLAEDDAMRLVALRGRAMAEASAATPTGMSAVLGGDPDDVLATIERHDLTPANVNGAGQVVAAGALPALAALADDPPAKARVIPLKVAGAFHTHYMAPAVEALRAAAADHDVSDPGVTLVSNRDGATVTDGREVLDRIVAQVSNPVRWDLCMERFAALGVTGIIELPPSGTLVGLAKRALKGVELLAVKTPDDLDAARTLLEEHSA